MALLKKRKFFFINQSQAAIVSHSIWRCADFRLISCDDEFLRLTNRPIESVGTLTLEQIFASTEALQQHPMISAELRELRALLGQVRKGETPCIKADTGIAAADIGVRFVHFTLGTMEDSNGRPGDLYVCLEELSLPALPAATTGVLVPLVNSRADVELKPWEQQQMKFVWKKEQKWVHHPPPEH